MVQGLKLKELFIQRFWEAQKYKEGIRSAQEMKHGTEWVQICSSSLCGRSQSNLGILKMSENAGHLEVPVPGPCSYKRTLGSPKSPSPSGVINFQHKRGGAGKLQKGIVTLYW